MNQILLITDGCSNVGESPVTAASRAWSEGICVNVIGIVDEGVIGERGALEIEEIARAGGGVSRIVEPRQLSETVRMMTHQTAAVSIRQAAYRELRQLFGVASVAELPPERRAEAVERIRELEETAALRVALLIDASASMKPKLRAVEEAIRDLALSLEARSGQSLVAVFHFPGESADAPCALDCGWTQDAAALAHLFSRIRMKGTTPTGPALLQVVDYFRETCGKISREEENAPPRLGGDIGGVLSDIVV